MNDLEYDINGSVLVNRVSGAPIPEHEPVFVLRARDWLALPLLHEYANLCDVHRCVVSHLNAISENIRRFREWRNQHPLEMKQPGITEHMKLENR